MEAVRPEWSEQELPLPEIEQPEAVATPESAPEESHAPSFSEGELATKALEKQPVVASDIVSKAAEKDKPKEKELEERHERRGSLDDQQAVSVGSILAKMPAQQPKQAKPKSSPLSEPVKPPVAASPAAQDETPEPPSGPMLYQQAIRTGFIAAVLVIFFFILLLILT